MYTTKENKSCFELLCDDIREAQSYYNCNIEDNLSWFELDEYDQYLAEHFYYNILERMSEWIGGEWVLTDQRHEETVRALRLVGLIK